MRTIRNGVIAAALAAAALLVAPATADEIDREVIDRADELSESLRFDAADSDRSDQAEFDRIIRDLSILGCAKRLLFASVIKANKVLGLDMQELNRVYAGSPDALRGRMNDALQKGSEALYTMLGNLVLLRDEEKRMEVIHICNDSLKSFTLD